MILSWIGRLRSRKNVPTSFPQAWHRHLERNVRHYKLLSESEQQHLRDRMRVFIAEKSWEGCGGLEMTDEIRVTIAAQACLMVLGFPGYCFDKVRSILVYPGAYMVPGPHGAGRGPVQDGPLPAVGLASPAGTVVLSWEEALEGARSATDGRNVVFHEFAHQLDMLDGDVGGMPPLPNRAIERRWHEVMAEEFARLEDDAHHGRVTLLDQYGASNEAEFFAVATECFFERPREMARAHPELFEILRLFYGRAQ